jgi:hypothetical protein
MAKFRISFVDRAGPPRNATNPTYPNGLDIDLSQGKPGCLTDLPYPAEERGKWLIECTQCGTNAMVTAAGRRDDPKTVRLQCKLAMFNQ